MSTFPATPQRGAPGEPTTPNADDVTQRYRLQERIGAGSFGTVYRATVRGSADQVAVKVVDLDATADELHEVRQELEALRSAVSCDGLVTYLGCHIVETRLWIVTEYLAGGSLGDLMEANGGPIPIDAVPGVLKELLSALAYLHGDRRVHRDVKGKNILVARDGAVKLADFGVATRLTDTTTKRASLIGTPYWMAPEVIRQSRYATAADVWSVGITAIELATRRPPHSELHPMKVLFVVPRAPPPELEGDFSGAAKAFVRRCVAKDPGARPSCAELLLDPFVAGADFQRVSRPALAELVDRLVAKPPEPEPEPEAPPPPPPP
eukprot:CAMPEP_0119286982 /NCGR_PEP_ID=MMETSP1329-20130426/34793_1 /TAXON_ID=114041 /ORGANISM="Genus nov. species nov., Strain RCC1024" /LENGTH=321 /DNA_ID=CAMNT_0007287729 /DNA_START=209 /DNA_END=1171 /DNA_ORIENTATION=+